MDFNPFPVQGYLGGTYFCDRDKETAYVKSALKNQRNITLISQRRLGKSTLIKHIFAKTRGVHTAYVDLYRTRDQEEMTEKLIDEILKQVGKPEKSFMKRIAQAIPTIEPTMEFDSMTGSPSIGARLREKKENSMALAQLFRFLESLPKRVYIAIDEFQEIIDYPEDNTEAILREHIQQLNNVHFIFSGSNQRMMSAIFGSHSRPFYQSTDSLYLEKIPSDLYLEFIGKHFRAGRKKIDDSLIEQLMEWCRGYTFYVQFFCNYLYSMSTKKYTPVHIRRTQEDILGSRAREYNTLQKLLSMSQAQVLRAIALEGHVTAPTSKDFVRTHDLSASSTVAQSVKALLSKELIHHEEEGYIVTDVFMSRWLATDI